MVLNKLGRGRLVDAIHTKYESSRPRRYVSCFTYIGSGELKPIIAAKGKTENAVQPYEPAQKIWYLSHFLATGAQTSLR